MRIDKIKINGFGKIKEKEIELKDGINVVYGGNEAGKSTLLKFIEAILYGVAKTKNGKDLSDFECYKPWSDGDFSGKLKYTLDNGKEYEVFRDFRKKNPVIYEANEDISREFQVNKAKEVNFFEQQVGMDELSFQNTAMIGQQEVKLERADTNQIVQKISNLVSSGDDTISFKKSMDQLNKLQNENVGTERTKQKPMNVVNDKLKKLLSEKNSLQFEKERLMKQLGEKEHIINELEELQEKKEELKNARQTLNEDRIRNIERRFKIKAGYFVALFLMIMMVLCLVIFKKFVLTSIPAILGIIDVFAILKMYQKEKRKNSDFDGDKTDTELEKVEARMDDLKLKNHVLEREKVNLDEKLEELARVEEELEEQKCIKEELSSLNVSYEIAKECMAKAYEEIKHNLSPKFEEKLCEITSRVTNGKYNKVVVNDENGLVVEVENGAYMPVNRLSLGTIDEMYLSLRLSILSEISKENLPILLDETFVYFDNERLKNMMCYLQDKNYNNQVIIFTCTGREEEMLRSLRIEYNLVKL